jgi:hypothetical protein
MKYVVDTNVPVVANRKSAQASPDCVIACVKKLDAIQKEHTLVLDRDGQIFREYKNYLSPAGQPGVGDAFFKWLLTNQANPERCEYVKITSLEAEKGYTFVEFPNHDKALAQFDYSDRKFVAVALAHPEQPPVVNAVDTDWWHYKQALEKHGLEIEFLCPEAMKRAR